MKSDESIKKVENSDDDLQPSAQKTGTEKIDSDSEQIVPDSNASAVTCTSTMDLTQNLSCGAADNRNATATNLAGITTKNTSQTSADITTNIITQDPGDNIIDCSDLKKQETLNATETDLSNLTSQDSADISCAFANVTSRKSSNKSMSVSALPLMCDAATNTEISHVMHTSTMTDKQMDCDLDQPSGTETIVKDDINASCTINTSCASVNSVETKEANIDDKRQVDILIDNENADNHHELDIDLDKNDGHQSKCMKLEPSALNDISTLNESRKSVGRISTLNESRMKSNLNISRNTQLDDEEKLQLNQSSIGGREGTTVCSSPVPQQIANILKDESFTYSPDRQGEISFKMNNSVVAVSRLASGEFV